MKNNKLGKLDIIGAYELKKYDYYILYYFHYNKISYYLLVNDHTYSIVRIYKTKKSMKNYLKKNKFTRCYIAVDIW